MTRRPHPAGLAELQRLSEKIGRLRAELRALEIHRAALRRELGEEEEHASGEPVPVRATSTMYATVAAVTSIGTATAKDVCGVLKLGSYTEARVRLSRALRAGLLIKVGRGMYRASVATPEPVPA